MKYNSGLYYVKGNKLKPYKTYEDAKFGLPYYIAVLATATSTEIPPLDFDSMLDFIQDKLEPHLKQNERILLYSQIPYLLINKEFIPKILQSIKYFHEKYPKPNKIKAHYTEQWQHLEDLSKLDIEAISFNPYIEVFHYDMLDPTSLMDMFKLYPHLHNKDK